MADRAILQKSKNAAVYQVQPLTVVLPVATTASSYLVVVVEGLKSGFPFSWADLAANTLVPTVSNDKGDTFTKIDQIVNLSQEIGSSPVLTQSDLSGFFPSAYVFLTAATTGTTSVSVSAFYPDEVTSPPQVGGRAVYDGGIGVQVYEVSNMTTGADGHANASSIGNGTDIKASMTPGGINELVLEVLLMMDSCVYAAGAGATIQDQGAFLGGSSFWAIQTTLQTSAVAAKGFKNPLKYAGGVIAVALK